MKKLLAGLFLSLAFPSLLQADNPDLFQTIQKQDSLLFNVGYNTCDITQFENLVSESFEFYHDQAGVFATKAAFIASIRDGLCKLNYKPRRVLVANSMEVYPLKKNEVLYGAIQTGVHRFYAIEANRPEYLTSTAKFSSLWLLENGQWKLSRVFSYDHQEPVKEQQLFKDKAETEKWMALNHIPALGIGYISNGKITETKVYGRLEAGGKEAPLNTVWNVASLTKPVTALVALKLADAGKWDLDTPLCCYWTDPDIADDPHSKKLTTRYVLSHQTGFPNWRWKTKSGKLQFEFDPGTKYQYSGEGYEYLRIALEKKFGKSLEQLAATLVFKPAGMADSRLVWDSSIEAHFARWHSSTGKLYETYKNREVNAADDLLTTVDDYTKFMLYVLNGAGLSKKMYRQMIAEQSFVKDNKYFGLGWSVDKHIGGNGIALNHGGDDKGVHTIVFILPESRQALLIFTNCDNGTDAYIPIITHYLGVYGKEIVAIETK